MSSSKCLKKCLPLRERGREEEERERGKEKEKEGERENPITCTCFKIEFDGYYCRFYIAGPTAVYITL